MSALQITLDMEAENGSIRKFKIRKECFTILKKSVIFRMVRKTKQISDYLVEFAKKKELRFIQDEMGNVVIFKEASKGYEESPTVILQGHVDMVCEKTATSQHDFEKDGLKLCVEGDEIYAKDTTLGGDDGIAVAYELAVLEDETLAHPAIEAVFTVDEEIGSVRCRRI